MEEKLRVKEIIIVEGKYDASTLAAVVDGLVLTTGGFSIFNNEEQKQLIRRLGKKKGIIILTDSDAAGFSIRHYIEKIAVGCVVKNAYIPAIAGKEGRKSAPSKEGTLGVEGLPPKTLRACLEKAGASLGTSQPKQPITYTDLYCWGLSGKKNSAGRLRQLLLGLSLPPRLSKKAVCQVFNSLYTKEEIIEELQKTCCAEG